MNWDAIGALGEWVGAGAVIITLIYLSLQVKSVKDQTSHTAHMHVYDTVNEFSRMIAESETLGTIIVKGRESYTSLADDERIRFEHAYGFLLSFLESWLVQLEQMNTVREKEEALSNIRTALQIYCMYPGVKELWSDVQVLYSSTLIKLFREVESAA